MIPIPQQVIDRVDEVQSSYQNVRVMVRRRGSALLHVRMYGAPPIGSELAERLIVDGWYPVDGAAWYWQP